jgi:hypothetical protein
MSFKMKTTRPLPALALVSCLVMLAVCDTSCSRPVATGRTQTSVRILSSNDAAQLAAKLANDECERLYKRRPFTASQYGAVLRDAEYHWGGLDEGGPGGYSAHVTFAQDGSKPKVEVYFSTDRLDPTRKLPPAQSLPKP